MYLNEHDPYAAAWLAHLHPGATIDTRSIKEVQADDLKDYQQVHLFAGIAGWCEALEIAGAADVAGLWTGSCPCQPYSAAGKGKGDADERNLWPEMFRLIRECRPATVLGEQVANAIGHGWLDRVFADLEGEGYACGAAVLPACSVGAPHLRQRLFWCARLADTSVLRRQGSNWAGEQEQGAWSRCVAIPCRDNRARRISSQSGDEPLAYGIPLRARHLVARLVELGADAKTAKRIVAKARGYGNAICPQVAAMFIRSVLT